MHIASTAPKTDPAGRHAGSSFAPAHLACTPQSVRWGRLPCRTDDPVLEVDSGEIMTIDTLSHEGALEDQGRDPARFFAARGLHSVLPDLVECAAAVPHEPKRDGPHFVTGPIHVRGAIPGDILQVDILDFERRCDYGVISDRHAKDVFAAEPGLRPPGGSSPLSEMVRIRRGVAVMEGFPPIELGPFLGIMGVATNTESRVHSSPPGVHGGNLDLRCLVAGTTLLLPVQVPGASFYIGDPHFAQGDGEVASTALEAPLTARLRLSVLPRGSMGGELPTPVALTAERLTVCGLDADLGRAARLATVHTLDLLQRCGHRADRGLLWLSAAADLAVTQVVDGVLGSHLSAPIAAFEPILEWRRPERATRPTSANHALERGTTT